MNEDRCVAEIRRRPHFDPSRPWAVSRATVRNDKHIYLTGGYADEPWPRDRYRYGHSTKKVRIRAYV